MNLKTLAGGAALTALSLVMTAGAAQAQSTSSGIRGLVSGESGEPVANAEITVTHTPSGTVSTARTNETGGFFASGLRVGGPYSVTISAEGFDDGVVTDIWLDAGEIEPFRVTLAAETEIVVTGVRNRLSLNNGAGSSFTGSDIASQPSFSRDLINTLLRDPLASNPGGLQGNLTVAGLNPRLNGLSIDGVLVQDDFGLGTSTYPTMRSPIALDTVEAASVVASDYSVMSSGFQGGLVNVVTRSGTNDFHGSLYYYGTNEDFVGNVTNGKLFDAGEFDEKEYGFTLGGPILRDRLFFFVGYEEFETARPQSFSSTDAQDNIANPAIFEALNDIISDSLGYTDAGGRPSTINNESTTERLLGKIDWNIADDHRASLSYSKVEETATTIDNLSMVSAWYATPIELETISLQVFSDWTDRLSTSLRISNKDFSRGQICNAGSGVGQIQVVFSQADAEEVGLAGMLSGGQSDRTFLAGCDRFRHGNDFSDERMQVHASANYILGDHVLTAGGDYENYELFNLFISDSLGTWIFDGSGVNDDNGLQNLIDGVADRVVYRNVASNNVDEAAAAWGYDKLSLFVQDEWQILPNLTFNAGLRYERFLQDDTPPARQDFLDAYGRTNRNNIDGLDIIQPRFGFRYDPFERTRITGGFGLFAGGDPQVWVSNAFQPQIFETAITNVANADPTSIPQVLIDNIAASNPNTPTFIDTISPDYEIPSQWKASLRLDQEFDLNFGGVNLGSDYLFTAQYVYTDTRYGYHWVNLAQLELDATQPLGVAPDGRPIYADLQALGINNAIELRNSEGGEGHIYTLALSKEYESGIGFYISYAHQDVESVTPGTSSRAVSNFRSIIDSDRNNPGVGRSEFEQEHKFAANFGYEKEFFGDLLTRIDVFGLFTSGEPFSYTFDTTSSKALFGRSGNNESPFDNDLLYVPAVSGGMFNDPRVVFAPGFDQQAFMDFVNGRGLPTGQIVPRHSDRSGWDQRWDLRFQQELPFANIGMKRFSNNRLKFLIDIENFANLLNDEWGTDIDATNFDTSQIVLADLVLASDVAANGIAGATALIGDAPRVNCTAAGACVYRFNQFTPRSASFADDAASVYRIRIGFRYEF